jgi:hypothetical protein
MKKIDFSKVEYENIDGKKAVVDVRIGIGNQIYFNAQDIAVRDLGRKIYKSEGEIELTDEEAQVVINVANSMPIVYREPIVEKLS